MIFRRKPKGYWRLVEPYWEVVSIYDGPDVYLSQISSIPAVSRNLLTAHWVQSEVSNGGFPQLFVNSTGVLVPEAIEGFRAIGMPEAARLVQRAASCFGPQYPRDRERRNEMWDRLEDHEWLPVEALNPDFWACLDSENGGFDVAADRYAEATK